MLCRQFYPRAFSHTYLNCDFETSVSVFQVRLKKCRVIISIRGRYERYMASTINPSYRNKVKHYKKLSNDDFISHKRDEVDLCTNCVLDE